MLSKIASFAKRISSPVAVVTVFTFSLLVAVSAPANPPLMSKVCPKLRCTLLPLFPAKSKPALVTLVMAVFTSPIFAALVVVVPPLATFVICLLPALIPAVVTLGPPVIVKPVVSNLLAPVVTLVKFKFLFTANATLFPVFVAVRLVSVVSTTPISTVSPALIAPELVPFVCNLKPPFSVVISLVFVAIFVVLVAI